MKCLGTNRNGKPCGRDAIKGGTVCNMHGGAAPQVRRAAALRLLAAVDPAITALLEDLKDKTERRIRQVAYRDILDRTGLKTAEKLIIEEPQAVTGFDADLSGLTNEELATARQFAAKIARKP